MESDTEVMGTQDATGTTSGYQNGARQQDRPKVTTLQMVGTNERELEEGWKRDAVTLTEEDYIRKHYYENSRNLQRGESHRYVLRTMHRAPP